MKRCMKCMEEYLEDENICPYCKYEWNTQVEEGRFIAPNTIISGRYVIGKVLGSGGFGITYIAWDEWLHLKVAIKEYFPVSFCSRAIGSMNVEAFSGEKGEYYHEGLKKAIDEARRLARFNNMSSVVKVYNCFEANETFYIVMEYLEGKTLSEILKVVGKIPTKDAIGLMLPAMNTLQKIHEEGLIHRDIAPDNIFITKDGRVVLLDLGSARYLTALQDKNNQSKIPIKDGYSPIEQYVSQNEQGSYTDVYSMGATLYRMITGRRPENSLIRRAMGNCDIELNSISDIDEQIKNAIQRAMNVDVENRTSAINEFKEELQKSDIIKNSNYNQKEHIRRLFSKNIENNFETIGNNDNASKDFDDDIETVFADEEQEEMVSEIVIDEEILNDEEKENEDCTIIDEVDSNTNIQEHVISVEELLDNNTQKRTSTSMYVQSSWKPVWTDETHKFVFFGTYPKEQLKEDEINEEILKAYYGINRTSNVRGIRYKRISELDVTLALSEMWKGAREYKFFRYEPIKWRVLSNENNVLMLISEDIIDCKRYHIRREEISWKNCVLRKWLNENFLKFAFDKFEVRYIKEIDGIKVDILSYEDAQKYFASSRERFAKGTEYAYYEGLWKDPKKETSWWWLSDNKTAQAAKINAPYDGYKNGICADAVNKPNGVRPVIYVNIVADI